MPDECREREAEAGSTKAKVEGVPKSERKDLQHSGLDLNQIQNLNGNVLNL